MTLPPNIRATMIGSIAVLLWSLLAVLTVATSPVPPLLLNTLCFAIGGLVGVVWIVATGGFTQFRQIPPSLFIFGSLGLFGYHTLYFYALRLAPPAEAGLIAYLWPLLIVLFSGFLPGEHLKKGHYLGAILGFLGAGLIIQGDAGIFDIGALPGYLLALAAAIVWAGYSVLSRSMGQAPTTTVALFCIGTAALSGTLHLMIEETIWPTTTTGWFAILALGLGPVGFAFYVWDIGVKQGDIQLLGVASYAAPLLSTLLLVISGITAPSWHLFAATILITGGAILAARASFTPSK